MSGRRYVTAGYVAEVRQSLSPSDWAVLADVDAMRLATAGDLQRLNGLREDVTVRHFRRRLMRLSEQQVLSRLEHRPIGGTRAGSAGWVYRVGPAGQRLLGSSARRAWTPRPTWVRHALLCGHLFVVLRQAEAAGHMTLLDFQAEPLAWRPFGDHPTTLLKPDAFVRLETASETVSAFIEVDCGTESPATIACKADVYERYWHSGVEQQTHGVFPEVVWLVPDERRAAVLRAVCDRQGSAGRLHRVALYADARSALLEPP